MHDTILAIFLLLTVTANAQAQFNTISSNGNFGREITAKNMQVTNTKESRVGSEAMKADTTSKSDSITPTIPSTPSDLKRNVNKCGYKPSIHTSRHTLYNRSESELSRYSRDSIASLPELTIPNLLAEIKRNGIRHPKIVLAQAILETGWFRSSVCRNKHNLFGLTNPRTKTYYEFNHWTESVRAYYTKVQYRWTRKHRDTKADTDYLRWLRDIGYAEDPGYIRAIIKVLKQL